MSEEINVASVREAILNANPVLEALSIVLKEVTSDTVDVLADVLLTLGHDPQQMPGEFLLQSMLVESEKVFGHIDRENWIKIYDAYTQVKAIIDGNPELQEEVREFKAAYAERLMADAVTPEPVNHTVGATLEVKGLLDGNF